MGEWDGEYSIPRDWGGERERLRLLEAWLDPLTARHLDALGIGPGWRCLEVGAGSGSVARIMAERVGESGRVVAADIDTRFLDGLAGAGNIEVRRCDVRVDDFPASAFDLIHTRWVLEHLPDRLSVMKRMVDWLPPGGWVCFEEPDCAAGLASPNPLWARHIEAYLADPAYDVTCGRALPEEVRSLGLVDLGMAIQTGVVAGGNDLARWHAITAQAMRSALVRTGRVTGEELDALCRALERPGLLEPGFTTVSVWGRKPA